MLSPRSALLTGLYPIHTGRQHNVIFNQEPVGLDPNIKLLPQYLKDLGYSTHMVGKWHLGFCNEAYLPTNRGFDTMYGFYQGGQNHYNHIPIGSSPPYSYGYDFRYNEEVDKEALGKYSAHLSSERAVKIIKEQEKSEKPMFMYLPMQNPHMPLQVPIEYEEPYLHIEDRDRRTYCGMVTAMDEAVGNVTSALEETGMINNTIIIFSSDNGGWLNYAGNNDPLRGGKTMLWEGGTRSPSFIYGGEHLKHRAGTTSEALFHVTDWLPTLLQAAGGSVENLDIDGVNQWEMLMGESEDIRDSFLYNIDPIDGNAAIRWGNFKLIVGNPNPLYTEEAPQKQLYNLKDDPSEESDIKDLFPDVVLLLEDMLAQYEESMVDPDVQPGSAAGDPVHFNGMWGTGWCEV